MRAARLPDPAALLRPMLLALAVAVCGAAHAAGFDLQALTQQLAQVRSGQAQFVEDRRIEQLDRTIRSSGRLSFSAPDTFVRETLKPRYERMAVVGNQLTLSRGDRTQTALLDSVPEAAVIVEAIRGTLTGNRETLERYFDTSVQGSPEQWELDLVPREPRLRGQVAQLHITGRRAQVREVRMFLPNGDSSVMRIEPLAGDAPARP
jgi:outer membrane lipoprotein-sorting protein